MYFGNSSLATKYPTSNHLKKVKVIYSIWQKDDNSANVLWSMRFENVHVATKNKQKDVKDFATRLNISTRKKSKWHIDLLYMLKTGNSANALRSRGVLVLLLSVQILVRLDCFSHSITMEVWKPTRWKTAKFHQNEHVPGCLITSSRLRGNKKRRQGFYDKPNHLRQKYPMKNVWPERLSIFMYEFLTTDNSLDPVNIGCAWEADF